MALHFKAQEQLTGARLLYNMAHELIELDEGAIALEGRRRMVRMWLENHLPQPIAKSPIVVRVAEALMVYRARRRFAYALADTW